MKKTIMIAGLMVVMVVALAGFASTAQAAFDANDYFYGILTGQTSPNGNVWQFKTNEALPYAFSGDLIAPTTIKVTYYLVSDPTTELNLEWKSIVINGNHVSIVFDPSDLKSLQDKVSLVRITGDLTDGLNFYSTGPGFAFVRTR